MFHVEHRENGPPVGRLRESWPTCSLGPGWMYAEVSRELAAVVYP